MAKAKWELAVEIFEPGGAGMGYPVVTHVFKGRTQKEARGYYDAHMGTDSFLRDCVKSGKFGTFKCRTFYRWRKLR
jgi:hypothetical protein